MEPPPAVGRPNYQGDQHVKGLWVPRSGYWLVGQGFLHQGVLQNAVGCVDPSGKLIVI